MTTLPARLTLPHEARLLCMLFFLSGASALVFESLWFYQATLVFGNSVWASSTVLSSFMAGLALGNALAVRFGHRVRNPVRLYALLEVVIACSGVSLVLVFPHLPGIFTSVFQYLVGLPTLEKLFRVSSAFALLLVPSTAMGMTLPILTRALVRGDRTFGRALGRLYGWNTIGAVVGVLLAEVTLVRFIGVTGTGLFAGALNVLVAAGAWSLSKDRELDGPGVRRTMPLRLNEWRLLCAAFLSGGILLALEVVWYRFLTLFFSGTTLAFALMLAVVLGGIGIGGLIAGRWLRADPSADKWLASVVLLSGTLLVVCYSRFTPEVAAYSYVWSLRALHITLLSLMLMFPVACVSGVIFTMIGSRLQRVVRDETEATGLLTLANTSGALLGALLGGFALLPGLGMERSLFILALAYGASAILLVQKPSKQLSLVGTIAATAFTISVALFPFGSVELYLSYTTKIFREQQGSELIAYEEGLTETIQLLRKQRFGKPIAFRLMTNGHSMSASLPIGRRYMKMFVYWPVAVHGDIRSALLISYGLGSTAEALTDTDTIEEISVVDVSREILQMSDLVFSEPGANPLTDPRVTVHIQDGRHFLQTSSRQFDLITGEPPPPIHAGIVSLYTREYFELVHKRLNPGGITTYWLPVHQLAPDSTKSILRAFCAAFEDCSLWAGASHNLMMAGTNGLRRSVSQAIFTRQWRDPEVGPEMLGLGFEKPEQLGATFIADAQQLERRTSGVEPLTDNYPKRLRGMEPTLSEWIITSWMDPARARGRYTESVWLASIWPDFLLIESPSYFAYQSIVNFRPEIIDDQTLPILIDILDRTDLVMPVYGLLGSSWREQRNLDAALASGYRAEFAYPLAVRALAERDYEGALRFLSDVRGTNRGLAAILQILALCRMDRAQAAKALAQALQAETGNAAGIDCW